MRRGIGRLRAGGTSGDADANAWAAAVIANGGTYSANTLAAVTTFTKSAKASGYWSKINRINLFCGDQLAAALVPLKAGGGSATETNVNFVSGDYTEATGLTGNGSTKYLRTGLIPSASLSVNDTHIAVYNRAASATGGGASLGARSPQFFELYAPFSDATVYDYEYTNVNNAGGVVVAVGAAPYGLFVGSRTGAAAHTLYKRGSSLGTDVGASGAALPSVEMYVFAYNSAATATLLNAHPLAGYSVGAGLSAGDVTAYNTDMQAFQAALSRSV